MNAIVPASLGALPAIFQKNDFQNNMSEGVGGAFGILTYRGKVWRIKYRGQEYTLTLPPSVPGGPPAGAKPTVEIIIVNASPAISKLWYKDGYSEGDKSAPDCSSVDGVRPDPASPHKQCETCAACPMNVWGSKMLPSGKPGKACQDYKRLAIVPAGDMRNETYGGPLLLRVPAGSLSDMSQYSNNLAAQGYPYFAVETVLSFDVQAAHPKLVFTASRVINEQEAQLVAELQNDPRTKRILQEAVDMARHEGVEGGANAGLAQPGNSAQASQPHVVSAPVPAAQPIYTMAQGEQFTREQYHAAGWTDDALVKAGKMTVTMPTPPAPTPPSAPVVQVAPPPPPVPSAPPVPGPAPVVSTAVSGAEDDDLAPPAFLQRQAPPTTPAPSPAPVATAAVTVSPTPAVVAPPPAPVPPTPPVADPMPAQGTPEFAAWLQRQAAANGVTLEAPKPAAARRRSTRSTPPPSPAPADTSSPAAADLNTATAPAVVAPPPPAATVTPPTPVVVATTADPAPQPGTAVAADPALLDVDAELERLLGQ
jgi:hypothetical protein